MPERLPLAHAEHQGRKVLALSFSEAADDELLLILNLHFQPALRTAALIRAPPILRNNPLHTHLADCIQHFSDIRFKMLGEAYVLIPADNLLEHALSLFKRHAAKIVPVKVKE